MNRSLFTSVPILASLLVPFVPRSADAQAEGPKPILPERSSQETLKTYVAPKYPEEGRRQGLGGNVTLKLNVASDGKVMDASVVKGIGPAFDEAALGAARRLEFHPAREDGRPAPSVLTFEYRFEPPGHTHAEPSFLVVDEVEEVTVVQDVESERPLTAASARTVRDRDLKLRPIQRPGDLFRVTPGLMIVQHAGGGKANQWLLRGFDADHGTDVALSFDGVPINMVSHGHGQGYADANFVIPELVERIEVSKGPYFVESGDFATAGSVDLATRETGENMVSLGGGSFDTVRALGIASPSTGTAWHPLIAAEVMRTDGPFVNPEDFSKYNLYGKLTYDLGPRSSLAVAASSYAGSWNASGQIPARAVRAGTTGFFGSLDPTEGGASSRQNAYASLRLRPTDHSELLGLVYASAYDFALYSNFTFFSRDPINGDQIEQRDERTMTGARLSYRWLRQWRGILFDSMMGGSARSDDIRNGLSYTRARERLATVVDDDVAETSIGAYAKEEVQLARWLRLVGGLRADHFTFQVNDRLEDLATQGTRTSGARGAGLLSPKATIVLSPHRTTDLFVNFGYGFHSNDARGVVRSTDPVTPLTRARGYEVGARMRLLGGRWETAVALWGLDIDSEIVWVGDEGTTEAAGSTRRIGADFESRLEILPWLFADADVTVASAKFRENPGNAQAVALAPRLTISGGLAALHPFGIRGAMRALHIAQRPATEDEFLKAEATTFLELFLAYRYRTVELALNVENLLGRRYKAAQFATVTRLEGEPRTDAPPPADACPGGTRASTAANSGNFVGCEDVSFSPGNPFGLRVTATYYF